MKTLAAVILVLSSVGMLFAQTGADEAADPRTLYQRGREEQARSNLLAAVELYRAALRENPAYHRPLIGLAETFFALEEYEEALEYLKEAHKLSHVTPIDAVRFHQFPVNYYAGYEASHKSKFQMSGIDNYSQVRWITTINSSQLAHVTHPASFVVLVPAFVFVHA